MLEEILAKFEDAPGQRAVVLLLLERGFSVDEEGSVVSGGIPIPDTGIAREAGVDRRVVDATTDAILADPSLRRIFRNVSHVPSLMDLAGVLDLCVITVAVHDAEAVGVIAAVTDVIAAHDVSIRQAISEDPEFTDDPKLYVVTEGDVPGDLVTDLRDLAVVRSIELR